MAKEDAVEAVNTVRYVAIDKLRFDPGNPRLVQEYEDLLDQLECAERLLDGHDPLPIGKSMVAFGYFPSDPLIATKDDEDGFLVHEGNRRLLAARLLQDQELREQLDADPIWDELADELVASPHDLTQLPVHVVATKDDAIPVIGFRHIVGIKKWGAYEKAAFVRNLLNEQDTERAVQRAAELTGESEHRIRTYLRDDLVLRQAEHMGLDVSPAREKFGAFTRLMNDRNVGDFLQLRKASKVEPGDTEGFSADAGRVRLLFDLLYGDETREPAFTDTRRIREFGQVVADEEAREHLARTRDLEESLALTGGVKERLLRNVSKAQTTIARIRADLAKVDADDPQIERALEDLENAVEGIRTPLSESEDVEGYDLEEEDEDEIDEEDEFEFIDDTGEDEA